MVDWREYIMSDPEILQGKPVIKNTRLSVEFILERLANGWSEEEILENYPSIDQHAIKAVFAYTYECLKDGMLFMQPLKRA